VSWLSDTPQGAFVQIVVGLVLLLAAVRDWRVFTRPVEHRAALRGIVRFRAVRGMPPRWLNRFMKPTILIVGYAGIFLFGDALRILAECWGGGLSGFWSDLWMASVLTLWVALFGLSLVGVVGWPRWMLLGPSRKMSDEEVLAWLHLTDEVSDQARVGDLGSGPV
jgi:hypothetical protein